MITISKPIEMQRWARLQRREGETIACVPTMGYLHDGHLSLVRRAKECASKVVLTLFVNPTQFAPNEDYATYPRDFDRDAALCAENGVDVVFAPSPEDMYFPDASVMIEEGVLSKNLCGITRPIHFRGVCTVVAKLFNCVLPDFAVFGQKDAQQASIIRRMVRDLNFPVQIEVVPIVREADGLALSSRNIRLTPEWRQKALSISRGLFAMEKAYAKGNGQTDSAAAIAKVRVEIEAAGLRVDYVEAVEWATMKPVETLAPGVLVAAAAYAGEVRLIDNIVL